jgi:hypothetical protein
VAIDDGRGKVDQLAVAHPRLLAQHLERARLVDRVAFHQNALGSLGQRAPPKRAPELVIFGEAPQHDVDRALLVLDIRITDIREHATLGRLLDERRVRRVEQNDHWTGSFANDLVDQSERVL